MALQLRRFSHRQTRIGVGDIQWASLKSNMSPVFCQSIQHVPLWKSGLTMYSRVALDDGDVLYT